MVNDDTVPGNNAAAILVNNNLGIGIINSCFDGNPAASLPYVGVGLFSNDPPSLLPHDKLSINNGTIGLHAYDKTILGPGSAPEVLRLCYDTSDYRLYQAEGTNLTNPAFNLVTRKILNELDDCVINTPVLNDVLQYNGTEFVNNALPPTTSTISGATDYDNSIPATDLQII